MSRLSPSGRSLIISISSSPVTAAQRSRSYLRTLCLRRDGSCLRLIHHSMSRKRSCIFRFLARTACRNTCRFSRFYLAKWCDTIIQKDQTRNCFYLYVSDQQCEEHQATEDIDYAEYHLETIARRGEIVTESTAEQFKELYKFTSMPLLNTIRQWH